LAPSKLYFSLPLNKVCGRSCLQQDQKLGLGINLYRGEGHVYLSLVTSLKVTKIWLHEFRDRKSTLVPFFDLTGHICNKINNYLISLAEASELGVHAGDSNGVGTTFHVLTQPLNTVDS